MGGTYLVCHFPGVPADSMLTVIHKGMHLVMLPLAAVKRFTCFFYIEVDGEDMDISPGCTATDELGLTKRTCTTSLPCDQQSSDPSSVVGTLTEDFSSNSTFLNTLGKLQQALQQVTVDKFSGGNSSKAVPSSVLSLLATLPSLIYKLKSAGEPQTSALCQNQPVDQQQITVQGQCSS